MRILVCGGRSYHNYAKVCEVLNSRPWEGLLRWYKPASLIITGGAPGADSCALRYAMERKVPYELYEAEWRKYGRRAGPIRNGTMIREGKPDHVVAFSGGAGTADMCRQARAAGIKVYEVPE